MPRPVFEEAQIHPAVRASVAGFKAEVLAEVKQAIAAHPVVVVGMRQNPFPRKARKALDAAGIAHHYSEYGSYLGQWRERLALKMWCGWPTLPMVFVKGQLVGGADETLALIASGELKRLLG